jgi:tetratricopeptide (TPR) repeat protein
MPVQLGNVSHRFYDQAFFLGPLALAYYESGETNESIETYKAITKLTFGRLYFGDIYTKSFYMLGKIHEEKGHIQEAIEYYQTFLEIWKNADERLPELADGKRRLARLKGSH